jgi:hypothetical protein
MMVMRLFKKLEDLEGKMPQSGEHSTGSIFVINSREATMGAAILVHAQAKQSLAARKQKSQRNDRSLF